MWTRRATGADDGESDDTPVEATATAPTFLLAPSTQLTLAPSSPAITAGDPVQWTVTETNDTPARYFPMALGDARVDLSTDGGVTTSARLDATSANFSGDTNGNGQLEVGETWTWTSTTMPLADTTLTATGFGTGTRGRRYLPADAEERSSSAVAVTPTTPPTTTPPSTTTPPTTTAPGTAPPAPSLPATGSPSSSIESAIAGATFLVAGLALVVISRRRPTARRVR